MVNKSLKTLASGLVLQVCGFVLFSTTLWVGAGEKIVFSDSSGKAEGSKPALTSEEISRRFNFIKRGATPDFSSGEIASPSVQPINPNLSRKLEDYFDQKKNWMFRPSSDKTTTMEERLGVRDNSIFDSGTKGRKGAIETYWENKDESKSKSKSKENKSKSEEDPEFKGEEDSDSTDQNGRLRGTTSRDGVDSEDTRENGKDGKDGKDATALNLQQYLNPANRMFGADDRLKENFGLRKFDFLPISGASELDPLKKAERQRLNDAHDADFQQMIQPRNITPSVAGAFDPINTIQDQTRQEANPFQSFSVGFNPSFGKSSLLPSQPSVSSLPLLARPPSEVNLAESIANRIALPSVPTLSVPSPVTSTFKTAPKPFVLEFPKRQF